MNTNYALGGAGAQQARMGKSGPELDAAAAQTESAALFDQLVSAHHRLEGVREMLHAKVSELFGPTPVPDAKPVPEPQGQLNRIAVTVRSVHEQIDAIQDLLITLRRL